MRGYYQSGAEPPVSLYDGSRKTELGAKNLTQRDINALIRLYNCPGFLTRLEQ